MIAATSIALLLAVRLTAQEGQGNSAKYYKYKLIDLGSLGGPSAFIANPFEKGLTDRGIAVGTKDTATPDPYDPNCFTDCFITHAFKWQDGRALDLGALPGPNSSIALWVNDRGVTVGLSENGLLDPLTAFPEIRAVIWQNGQTIDLGTLGGNASIAAAVNNWGQIVGAALNTTPDLYASDFSNFSNDYFPFPLATQSRAFLCCGGKLKDQLGAAGGGGLGYLRGRRPRLLVGTQPSLQSEPDRLQLFRSDRYGRSYR